MLSLYVTVFQTTTSPVKSHVSNWTVDISARIHCTQRVLLRSAWLGKVSCSLEHQYVFNPKLRMKLREGQAGGSKAQL